MTLTYLALKFKCITDENVLIWGPLCERDSCLLSVQGISKRERALREMPDCIADTGVESTAHEATGKVGRSRKNCRSDPMV